MISKSNQYLKDVRQCTDNNFLRFSARFPNRYMTGRQVAIIKIVLRERKELKPFVTALADRW